MTFSVPLESGAVTAAAYPAHGGPWLVLAHGAGADQRSRWMVEFAGALQARGVQVLTFNFPYTEQQRRTPDRTSVLEETWCRVVAALRRRHDVPLSRLCLGGKSMGGRMASHVLATQDPRVAGAAGLVLLGYPLRPPGRPERARTAHLPQLQTPVLLVQGTRDSFGGAGDVAAAFSVCPGPVEVMAIEDGDHSFKVRGGAAAQTEALRHIHDRVAGWVLARAGSTEG